MFIFELTNAINLLCMPLFQPSVVNKHLKTLDKQAVKNAYTKFKAHFQNATIQANIRNSKEEQYQGEFLIDLFVKVLGYTKNPEANYNLTTEYKNVKDSKKADGAIVIGGQVKAVIELKGTNTTDLGNVETQAFGYKNNQPECVYVITSNFEKLRFYIDNAIEFLEFNLFTLSEKEFELMYLCLAYSQIEKDITKKIKNESVSHEDEITKQLYRDYSLFKEEMHADLVLKNPEYNSLLLFQKTQKLLSRFLFLFFAEDRLLLPPNSVRLILSDWLDLQDRDVQIPLYERFKNYFEYLNTGYKGKRYEVFAYNGGLFKSDQVLDNVQIDNELLYRHTTKISEYDFASDVDVNILGHIFENSLNELDELTAKATGAAFDKSKTKRKRDGIVYTPKYITKYIVDNTVGQLCTEKKAELGINDEEYCFTRGHAPLQKKRKQILADNLITYRNWLLQITICDPACGSGAFLNQALNFLIDEHRYIDELQAKLFGDALVLSDFENTILENNLFGVDLNEESVEIAKLSLWLRTAQPNRKLNDLSRNIKCGNSLIDDPAVAGEKAFVWEKEFPQIFGDKAIVEEQIIAKKDESPDYLKLVQDKLLASQSKAEQALELSKLAIELSKKAYEYAQKLEAVSEPTPIYGKEKKGFDVVIGNPPYGAKLDHLTQKYLNDKYIKGGSETAISFIKQSFDNLLNINGILSFIIPKAFTFASNYESIRAYLLPEINEIIDCKKVWTEILLEQIIFIIHKNRKLNHYNCGKLEGDKVEIIGHIEKLHFQTFGFYLNNVSNSELNIGLKIRKSNKYIGNIAANSRGGIFQSKISENGDTVVLGGAEIQRFGVVGSKGRINKEILTHEPKCFINENSILVQNIVAHIENPSNHIKITACLPANKDFAIVDTINQLTFYEGYSSPVFWLLLNSKLINWYSYRFIFARAIRTMHFDNSITNRIPIPDNFNSEAQQPFIAKADQLLLLNTKLQNDSGKFQRNLKREFKLNTLPTKLHNWYLLSYGEFIKELDKLKVKLTLSQKADWEYYFGKEAEIARTIKAQIDSTDAEIDRMVYALYNLTDDEIKIVEQN